MSLNIPSSFNSCSVLIDTWWNVNKDKSYLLGLGEGSFNRYMVECEYVNPVFIHFSNRVLIDIWWNVNQLAEGGVLKKGQVVLIDTWWNVNEWYKHYGLNGGM